MVSVTDTQTQISLDTPVGRGWPTRCGSRIREGECLWPASMQLRACVSWSQTLCGQMRSKPVSKGHISVSPAAKHCLRYPKPQANRLQSCSSSRARDQGLPPPHGYQKTQNQEGCMTEIHRKNHHPMGVKMKVS